MGSNDMMPKDVGSLMETDAPGATPDLSAGYADVSRYNDVTAHLAGLADTEAMEFAIVVYAAQTDGFGKQFMDANGADLYAKNGAFDETFPVRVRGNQECALFTSKGDLEARLPEIAAKLLDSGNTEHKAVGRRVLNLLSAEEQESVKQFRHDAVDVLRRCDANGTRLAA